jgi:hypothetical protein
MLLGIPWVLHIGSIRVSPYRIFLCLALVPCLLYWGQGKAGGIKAADLAVFAFAGWVAASFVALHGSSGMQPAGISVIETLTPYLLARCCIRNADDFRLFSKALFGLVAILLPFVVIETATGWNGILGAFGLVLPTYEAVGTMRAGLWRAQGAYDHPILLGLVCSTAFSVAYLVLGHGRALLRKASLAAIVAIATICSLSSGPMLGIFLQCILIGWKRVADVVGLRLVWVVTILSISFAQVACWLSNRSLLDMTISRLTFDPLSYWFRNLIWQYGWSSVLNHVWLGSGMREWDRPSWMPGSIDNVWLYFAVKHGLPASLLLGLSVGICLVTVGLKPGLDARQRDYRSAYLVTVISCVLVGLTVHFWDGAYVLIFCLLGSGLWIVDIDSPPASSARLQRRPPMNRRRAPVASGPRKEAADPHRPRHACRPKAKRPAKMAEGSRHQAFGQTGEGRIGNAGSRGGDDDDVEMRQCIDDEDAGAGRRHEGSDDEGQEGNGIKGNDDGP